MKEKLGNFCINLGHMFKGQRFWKLMLTISLIAGISLLIYGAFKAMGLTDPTQLGEKLSGLGFWVYIIYIAIFVVQAVCLSFIPGNTTIFVTAGFILFGGNFWEAFLVCAIAVVFASMALYAVGRFGGRRLMFWLFGREVTEKYLNWIGEKGTQAVPWLFLIPLMPTDIICLVCGASRMKFWQFMMIVIVFRPVEVVLLLSYNFLVPMLFDLDPIMIFLVINMVILDMILLFLYYKSIMKFFKKYTSPFTDMFKSPKQAEVCACNTEPLNPTPADAGTPLTRGE